MEAFDRNRIVEAIEENLTHQPNVRTRHRKPVRSTIQLDQLGITWQLAVGEWRVDYDVQDETVLVLVVRIVEKGGLTTAEALADESDDV